MQRSPLTHAHHRRGGPSIGARSTTTAYLRRRLGLTLLELIVVLVLLGVLAAIAVPTYLSVIRSSENHAALITLENFATDAWANAKATGETYLTQTAIDAAAKDVTAYATGTGPLAAGIRGIRLVTTSKRYGTAATGIGKLHPTVMWSAMVSKAADCVYVKANAGSILLAKVGYPPGVTPPNTCKVPTTAAPVPGGGGGAGTPAVRALSATTAIPPDPPTTLAATPTSRSCNGNGITPSGYTTASAYVRALSAPSVSSSLLAWYPMGSFPKGPTTTAASALTGRTKDNGTFASTGPAGVQTSGEAGPFGITGTPSADFPSGADFYADTATTAPTSAVTVSVWLGVSTQTNFTIANDFTPSSQSFTGSPTYLLTDNAAGHELVASVTTSSGTSAPTTYSLTVPYATLPGTTANELFWHDVSMTYNGTSLILYVDGQQVGSTPASGTLVDTSSALRLGAKNTGVNTSHEYADVWVSNISVAASAFSPTLEASLFAAGATGPVVKYHVIGEGTETLTPSSKTGRQQTGDYLATAGAGSYDAPALSLTTSCLSSSGTSYPLATEPVIWTEATSAGQGFVVATATQKTTLSSAPTKTAATYTDYTNATGVAKAWAVATIGSQPWNAGVAKDAAGNRAAVYKIVPSATSNPRLLSTVTLAGETVENDPIQLVGTDLLVNIGTPSATHPRGIEVWTATPAHSTPTLLHTVGTSTSATRITWFLVTPNWVYMTLNHTCSRYCFYLKRVPRTTFLTSTSLTITHTSGTVVSLGENMFKPWGAYGTTHLIAYRYDYSTAGTSTHFSCQQFAPGYVYWDFTTQKEVAWLGTMTPRAFTATHKWLYSNGSGGSGYVWTLSKVATDSSATCGGVTRVAKVPGTLTGAVLHTGSLYAIHTVTVSPTPNYGYFFQYDARPPATPNTTLTLVHKLEVNQTLRGQPVFAGTRLVGATHSAMFVLTKTLKTVLGSTPNSCQATTPNAVSTGAHVIEKCRIASTSRTTSLITYSVP